MAELTIQATTERVDVFRSGQSDPMLVQHAKADTRAHIHPIVAPDGKGRLTEDTPSHHPWQHGLYVGLNEVNGVGFWTEGLLAGRQDTDGTFHPWPIANASTHDNAATWTVTSDWRDPSGASMLTETQAWTLTDQGATYDIDLAWSLTAALDIRFGEYAYGGIFLRMPYRKDGDGEAVNNNGQVNTDAEGQRAKWVSVSVPLEGRDDWAGIAIMDHPSNPEHPTPWRVDGQLGIAPSRCIAGPWTLLRGETTTTNYRLLAFCGPTDPPRIHASWSQFAQCRPKQSSNMDVY